jgi:hypothetical protein
LELNHLFEKKHLTLGGVGVAKAFEDSISKICFQSNLPIQLIEHQIDSYLQVQAEFLEVLLPVAWPW